LKTESLNFRELYSLGQFCTKASILWRQADCPPRRNVECGGSCGQEHSGFRSS